MVMLLPMGMLHYIYIVYIIIAGPLSLPGPEVLFGAWTIGHCWPIINQYLISRIVVVGKLAQAITFYSQFPDRINRHLLFARPSAPSVERRKV